MAIAPFAVPVRAQDDGDGFRPHLEPASGEAEAKRAGFALAPGLATDLFAAEPMLANPVCLYVDHAGDVWVGETFRHYAGVTDMREHMDWLDEDLAARTVADRLAMMRAHEGERFDAGYNVAHDRIRLLRDADGDGKADTAVVFADGFKDHAAGIGAGVLSYRGDVWYTCIPDLWRLRDVDGDGAADERERLHTGYGVHVALLGHDLHGLRIGPDRRLYFSIGDRAFHVETPEGILAHPESGAVLRCELDGSRLEIVHDGLRNPQELVFDDLGNLWTGDNNSDGGDRARWVHVVPGGDSGWRYPYQWIGEPVARGPWNDEELWHPPHAGQAAYHLPPVANLADGPSGLTFYPGTGLSSEYARHFFLCDFRGDASYSGIHTFTVEPKGAFWTLGPVERFIWNTLVTDCDFGPDGYLYFSDWVHGWNKTGKGRVYRAFDPREVGSPEVLSTRELLAKDLTTLSTPSLGALLAHADQRVRQEAHFALADRGKEGIEELGRVAHDRWAEIGQVPLTSDVRLPRVHAIWGLAIASRSFPEEAERRLLGLWADPDPEIRGQVLRVIGDEGLTSCVEVVVAGLSAPEARVRFLAALAVGRLGAPDAFEPLARLLDDARSGDPNLRHAAVMGLLGTASAADVELLASADSVHRRMGALLLMRRRHDASIARFLADGEPHLVLEAARAIHDVPIDDAMPALADLVLPEGAGAALARRVLAARLRLGDAERLAAVALRADLDDALRAEALTLLASWADPPERDPVTGAWRPLVARPLADVRPLLGVLVAEGVAGVPDAVAVAFCRLVAACGAREHAATLVDWLRSGRRASVRIAALSALEQLEARDLASLVRGALGDADGEVRAAALSALERLAPGEALPSLAGILALGETPERRVALRILGHSGEDEAIELLRGELKRRAADLFPDELDLDLVLAVEAAGDAGLLAQLSTQNAARASDPELAPWLDSLEGGDPASGRRLFERLDLSCLRCHNAAAEGAKAIGPDLAGVATRLSRVQMLESIVAPNRRTTPGFAGTVLFLADGKVVNGRIVEETEEAIRVLDADGKVTDVSPEDVEEQRPDLSAMPQDVATGLSREEMRDLIAYLASL